MFLIGLFLHGGDGHIKLLVGTALIGSLPGCVERCQWIMSQAPKACLDIMSLPAVNIWLRFSGMKRKGVGRNSLLIKAECGELEGPWDRSCVTGSPKKAVGTM